MGQVILGTEASIETELTQRVCKMEHGVSVLNHTPTTGLLSYGVSPLGRAVENPVPPRATQSAVGGQTRFSRL